MLYILVVCAGHLCMPVETVGAYTLTRAECQAPMMQTPGADVRCYSNANSEYWDYEMVLREPEPSQAAVSAAHFTSGPSTPKRSPPESARRLNGAGPVGHRPASAD